MKSAVVVLAVISGLVAVLSEAQGASFEKAALAQHNFYRKMHGVQPLTLDSKLTRVAQKWANILARADEWVLHHNPDSKNKYGENVYKSGKNYQNKDHILGKEVVDCWYNEVKMYTDYNNDPLISGYPEFKHIGHFTQVVWKDTTKVGVAKAVSKNGNTYVVANYWPPGNYPGGFVANVLPPTA